jgi:hypothetical protein
MPVRDYDPDQGQAFQGDVAIMPIPNDIAIATNDEVVPMEGRLIVHVGEQSGHHHAIDLFNKMTFFRDDGLAREVPGKAHAPRPRSAAAAQPGTAHLYLDDTVAEQMVARGLLTRSDLVIGCLVVKTGPVVINHDEHDGIRIPPGNYLVGRQIEGDGTNERMVVD